MLALYALLGARNTSKLNKVSSNTLEELVNLDSETQSNQDLDKSFNRF